MSSSEENIRLEKHLRDAAVAYVMSTFKKHKGTEVAEDKQPRKQTKTFEQIKATGIGLDKLSVADLKVIIRFHNDKDGGKRPVKGKRADLIAICNQIDNVFDDAVAAEAKEDEKDE